MSFAAPYNLFAEAANIPIGFFNIGVNIYNAGI